MDGEESEILGKEGRGNKTHAIWERKWDYLRKGRRKSAQSNTVAFRRPLREWEGYAENRIHICEDAI